MAETTQSIREIFRNALLAQAACADLTSAVRNASGWQTALGAGQAPMNGAMAQYFASKFTALAHSSCLATRARDETFE